MLRLVLGALFFLARAGEMFASKEGCWDDGHILRRGDVVFSGQYPTRLDNVGSHWLRRGSVPELERGPTAGRNGDDAYSRGTTSPVAGWWRDS